MLRGRHLQTPLPLRPLCSGTEYTAQSQFAGEGYEVCGKSDYPTQLTSEHLKLYCSCINPLPTNDAHVASWTLHKSIGIHMGDLILDVIFQFMHASFSCF